MTDTPAGNDIAPLDGNAAAGLLSEFFAVDITTATLTCGRCGAIEEIGATQVYGGSMGAIFRCIRCDNEVMRFTHTSGGFALDLRGAKCLFLKT